MRQRVPFQAALLLVAALGFAACGEPPTDPLSTDNPLFKKGGKAVCPIPANVVVTDEASLLAALAAANPGDVIGLDGLIELTTSTAVVATDGVTLTCATAGSGLFGDAGGGFSLVWVTGNGVAVDRLVLDGRQLTGPTAYVGFGEELSFSNNRVQCGGICAWFQGALAPSITDNSFDATDPTAMVASFSAIQIQGGTTRALVERNAVVGSGTTGIRIRTGVDHTVNHNSVSGDWESSISACMGSSCQLTGTEIKSNRLEGAVNFGLEFGGSNATLVATHSVVRNNQITGAGQAGVSVNWACGNTFEGNNLSANNVGLVFNEFTGANTGYKENKYVVVDDGDLAVVVTLHDKQADH